MNVNNCFVFNSRSWTFTARAFRINGQMFFDRARRDVCYAAH